MSTDTALPPLYAKWTEQLLGVSIPAETEADCFECSMTGTGSSADRVAGLSYYRPETKCCTHHPFHELPLWCVAQIAPSTGIVDALLRYLEKRDYIPEADEIDGFLKPARRRELWSGWHGRERDCYLESARFVESLSWNDVLSQCGPRVVLLACLVTEAHHALFMTPQIPDRLRAGEIRLLRYGSEKCFVLACEEVLEFPRRLMEVLTVFDGRPVAEARQAIYQEKKVRMSDALIQRLVDFELLIPVEPTH